MEYKNEYIFLKIKKIMDNVVTGRRILDEALI